jgi:amino acid permease
MTENNAAGINSHTGNVDEKFVPIDPVDNEKIQVEEEETKDQVQNDPNVQNGNLKRNLKTRHLQMSELTHLF